MKVYFRRFCVYVTSSDKTKTHFKWVVSALLFLRQEPYRWLTVSVFWMFCSRRAEKKRSAVAKNWKIKVKNRNFQTKFGVLQQNNYKRVHGEKNKMKSLRYNSLKDLFQREENKTCLCTSASQKKFRSTKKRSYCTR